jgi:hypothetical protein
MKKPLKYTDDVDESWADTALTTIRVSASPNAERPIILNLQGACPRCAHDMSDEHWLITFTGVSSMQREDAIRAIDHLRQSGAVRQPLLPAEFTVQCTCGHQHPDPLGRSGLKGCGAVWRMRVE